MKHAAVRIEVNAQYWRTEGRKNLPPTKYHTLGFLFLEPFGRPLGLFITGVPSSSGFCGEKVNKHLPLIFKLR